MSSASVAFIAAVGLVLLVAGKVMISLLAKEVEGRLDQVGFAILRIARWRLPAELREPLYDEAWLPELHYILEREEARPLTRLIQGLRYACGVAWSARTTARAASLKPRRFAIAFQWLLVRRWGRVTAAYGPSCISTQIGWLTTAGWATPLATLVGFLVLVFVVVYVGGVVFRRPSFRHAWEDLTTYRRLPLSRLRCHRCDGFHELSELRLAEGPPCSV